MTLILKVLCLIFILFSDLSRGQQDGFCYTPFDSFINCMIPEAQSRFNNFMLESSPVVQERIYYCFTDSQCRPPTLRGATLKSILPAPWPYRVHLMFDLFESAPDDVQSCMIDYLLEKAKNYTQTCIQKHGAGTVAAQFKLKRLPRLKNLDITALKKAIVNRILVTSSSIDCSKKLRDDAHLQATLDCIKTARNISSTSTCDIRNKCKKETKIPKDCSGAFNAVQSASCSCFKEEQAKLSRGDLSGLKRMIDFLVKGGLIKQYRLCSLMHNKFVPEHKLSELSAAIRASVKETVFEGLPKRVQQVSAQMIAQISEEVQKLLCGDACVKGSDIELFKDAKRIRQLTMPAVEERQEGLFSRAINTFFKGITHG